MAQSKETKNAKQREYYARHRATELAKQKQRRIDKAELISAQRKARYWKDPEKYRTRSRDNYTRNREARVEWAREYRYLNKDTIRFRKIQATYGLTKQDFIDLWNSQNGLCAICNSPLTLENRKTHVDHNHKNGKVRGLLCVDCNVGIGRLKDSPFVAFMAALYLGRRS